MIYVHACAVCVIVISTMCLFFSLSSWNEKRNTPCGRWHLQLYFCPSFIKQALCRTETSETTGSCTCTMQFHPSAFILHGRCKLLDQKKWSFAGIYINLSLQAWYGTDIPELGLSSPRNYRYYFLQNDHRIANLNWHDLVWFRCRLSQYWNRATWNQYQDKKILQSYDLSLSNSRRLYIIIHTLQTTFQILTCAWTAHVYRMWPS